eukprot:m.28823 g.28823  ORF g.28823 m.28823 type:complete len:96 (+) comp8953_c1_seq1:1091-1378(+)
MLAWPGCHDRQAAGLRFAATDRMTSLKEYNKLTPLALDCFDSRHHACSGSTALDGHHGRCCRCGPCRLYTCSIRTNQPTVRIASELPVLPCDKQQ